MSCNPDPSAMLLDDLFADRQADAVARILGAGVQALKDDEDVLAVLRCDADAVVRDREHPFIGLLFRADLHRRSFGSAELKRVADQILKHLREWSLSADHF